MLTLEQVDALSEAVLRVLDDMGMEGTSVSVSSKAALRLAYEPFSDPREPMDMLLNTAQAIIDDLNKPY